MLNRIGFIFVWLSIPWLCFAQQASLTLSTWVSPPLSTNDQSGYLDQILIEAFQHLDLTIQIKHKPPKRSIRDANLGIEDGEFIRVSDDFITKTFPNLERVPEAIFELEIVAFTKKKGLIIENWESLRPYKVGIRSGAKILEEKVQNTLKREALDNVEHLLKMLDEGRIDIAILTRYFGNEMIRKLGLQGIVVIEPPLAVRPMYLYLHKKHSALVSKLAKVLKTMKEDGTFLRIQQKTLP